MACAIQAAALPDLPRLLLLVLLAGAPAAQGAGDEDNDEETVDLPVLYIQTLRQEILDSGQEWRPDDEDDVAWRREPQYERQGRIVFGYDAVYDETRAREDLFRPANRHPLQQPEPATLIRIRF